MNRLCLGFLGLLVSFSADGSEIGISQTQSSTAIGRRVKLAYDFSLEHKLTLFAKKTTVTMDVDDTSASQLQLSYQYRPSRDLSFSFSAKRSDEIYYYASTAGNLRVNYTFEQGTSVSLGLGFGRRNYIPVSSETLNDLLVSASVEQDFLDDFTVGAAADFQSYQTGSLETARAFKGQTIVTTDISSYVDLLMGRSVSVYFEYVISAVTMGLSYTVDTYALSSVTAKTYEVYGDARLGPSWLLGVFAAQGRSDVSAETVRSSGLSLSYLF